MENKLTCKLLKFVFIFCIFTNLAYSTNILAYSTNIKDIDDLLKKGDYIKAYEILNEKYNNNTLDFDEFLRYFFIKEFLGKEREIKDTWKYLQKSKNPFPYIDAFLRSTVFIGEHYFYKEKNNIELMEAALKDKSIYSKMRSAISYRYAMLHLGKDKKKYKSLMKETSIISKWQFVGPFYNNDVENLDENFGPETISDNNHVFESIYGYLKWFTPKSFDDEGWTVIAKYLQVKTHCVYYAQTFVYSEEEKEVVLGIGFSGMIKVYLNDKEVFNDNEFKKCDYDTYYIKVKLNKGNNRILVKLGNVEYEYPNFALKILDTNLNDIDIKYTETAQPNSKATDKSTSTQVLNPTEAYFVNLIEKEPNNVYHRICLLNYYIRNEMFKKGENLINEIIKMEENNPIVLFYALHFYSEMNNNLKSSEFYYLIENKFPECYIEYVEKYINAKNSEDYTNALNYLNTIEEKFGYDPYWGKEKLKILLTLKDVNKFFVELDKYSKLFPFDPDITTYQFVATKLILSDHSKAEKINLNYLKNFFVYNKITQLKELYLEQNQIKKAEKILLKYFDFFKNDKLYILDLIDFYFQTQNYQKSKYYCLKLNEFCYNFDKSWLYLGYSYERLNQIDSAIYCFKKALEYNPYLFEIYDRIRFLQNKPSLVNLFNFTTIDKDFLNKCANFENNEDLTFLIYEKCLLLYPKGGFTEILNVAVKVNSEKGIDKVKNIKLNEKESLFESYMIKSNGKKVSPKIYEGNEIIWENIEIGDIVYLKIKGDYVYHGKFRKEYNNYFIFSGLDYTYNYNIKVLVPDNINLKYKFYNTNHSIYSSIKFDSSKIENYKYYSWSVDKISKEVEEKNMPDNGCVFPTLLLTTLKSWDDIKNWYATVINSKLNYDDYEITQAFDEIFPDKNEFQKLNDLEKAKKIYNYINSNIRYLNNKIAQDNYIPQDPSKTLVTKLGDCKDLTILFLNLAHMAGLKANAVLVRTKDKTQLKFDLPEFFFDHLMAKVSYNIKEYFIELTENKLPFLCLPENDYNAIALDVPNKNYGLLRNEIFTLNPETRCQEEISINSSFNVKPESLLLNIKQTTKNFGNSAIYLNEYFQLDSINLRKKVLESLQKKFDKPVNLLYVKCFKNEDTIFVESHYDLSGYINKVGNYYTLTIPFKFKYFGTNIIQDFPRKYDFLYTDYEDIDFSKETITIQLPDKFKFTQIPKNATYEFNGSTYKINFKLLGNNKLLIDKTIKINKKDIPNNQYEPFKSYIKNVLDKENELITFQ